MLCLRSVVFYEKGFFIDCFIDRGEVKRFACDHPLPIAGSFVLGHHDYHAKKFFMEKVAFSPLLLSNIGLLAIKSICKTILYTIGNLVQYHSLYKFILDSVTQWHYRSDIDIIVDALCIEYEIARNLGNLLPQDLVIHTYDKNAFYDIHAYTNRALQVNTDLDKAIDLL